MLILTISCMTSIRLMTNRDNSKNEQKKNQHRKKRNFEEILNPVPILMLITSDFTTSTHNGKRERDKALWFDFIRCSNLCVSCLAGAVMNVDKKRKAQPTEKKRVRFASSISSFRWYWLVKKSLSRSNKGVKKNWIFVCGFSLPQLTSGTCVSEYANRVCLHSTGGFSVQTHEKSVQQSSNINANSTMQTLSRAVAWTRRGSRPSKRKMNPFWMRNFHRPVWDFNVCCLLLLFSLSLYIGFACYCTRDEDRANPLLTFFFVPFVSLIHHWQRT